MAARALGNFGAGRLYGTRQDVSNQTPLEFAVLQNCDFDCSFTTKPLYGSNQFALFIPRGEAKMTLKAKSAVISGQLLSSIFWGISPTVGQTALVAAESHSVPGSSTYTITPTPPNAGTFATDQGVAYASGGTPFELVASGPTQGQYSVSAGVYTFAAADASAAVLISYTYTCSTPGQKIAITNQELGPTPYFSGVFRGRDPRSGLFNTLILNRMTSNKLAISSKTSDWSIPEFDAEIMDDGAGNIGTMSFGDLS
jgi:hypothetical protein